MPSVCRGNGALPEPARRLLPYTAKYVLLSSERCLIGQAVLYQFSFYRARHATRAALALLKNDSFQLLQNWFSGPEGQESQEMHQQFALPRSWQSRWRLSTVGGERNRKGLLDVSCF